MSCEKNYLLKFVEKQNLNTEEQIQCDFHTNLHMCSKILFSLNFDI